MKARHAKDAQKLTDIPNVGPRIAGDFELLGLKVPSDLVGRDAFVLYTALCTKTGERHDPCVLDTFMAAVDFMQGSKPRKWWYYTAERKRRYPRV